MQQVISFTKKQCYICIFLLYTAYSFLLYGNTINGGFVYDDRVFVEAEELKTPGGLWLALSDSYFITKNANHFGIRPLSTFSFSLNYNLFGTSPISFHIVNIILHALASFFVFVLVRHLFKSSVLAFFTATLFLVLPIHTEAVASIKARDEILGGIFVLLSWIVFVKGGYSSKFSWRLMCLSAVLFILGLLSKELVVGLPFLYFFVLYVQKKPLLPKVIKMFLPFTLLYSIYFFVFHDILLKAAAGEGNLFIINPLQGSPYVVRFWTAFKISFIYFYKSILPVNLSASYDYNELTAVHNPFVSIEAVCGIVVMTTLVFFMLYKKTRATPVGVGSAIFLVSTIVFSKFIFAGGQILAERWMYFASLGVCLWLGYVLSKVFSYKKYLAYFFFGGLLTAYSFITIQRNPVWANEFALFQSMVKTAPNSIVGHHNLAEAYLREGDFKKAIPHIEACMRIYLNYEKNTSMLNGLALYYSEKSKTGKSVVVRGTGETNSLLLAMAFAKDGKSGESLDILKDLDQKSPIVLFTNGVNYYKLNGILADELSDWIPGKTNEEKVNNLRKILN